MSNKEKEIAEEYASSLADLTVNSKPLINMLTILAEENLDHAGIIVETVEKHLEKVQPDVKLPVLYLVDSIIKNVGGDYIAKFSQCIVNMFTRTFRQVDEKIRSQMFKLRETWHDVFPATKLYQLDVKVNLVDPAWPIQAQPQPTQSTIHVNPNFLKKPSATASMASIPAINKADEDEQMRILVAKKQKELLMLQRKTIEVELEQTKKQLSEKSAKKVVPPILTSTLPAAVNPAGAPAAILPNLPVTNVSVRQRLGPPVNKPAHGRIAPVSGALATARRDPRLARHPPTQPPQTAIPPMTPIVPNIFDIKPLERVTKRKNVITIDVNPEETIRDPRRRDPRVERLEKKRDDKPKREKSRHDKIDKREDRNRKDDKDKDKNVESDKNIVSSNFIEKMQIADAKIISKLPPIPKINRDDKSKEAPSPIKKRKDTKPDKKKKRDNSVGKDSNSSSKDSNSSNSPEKKIKSKENKNKSTEKAVEPMEVELDKTSDEVKFKELKNFNKQHYRRKEKSESPEVQKETPVPEKETSNHMLEISETKDVDLRVLHPVVTDVKAAPLGQKRPSTETVEGKSKKNKLDKFDILFGSEDVDLRQMDVDLRQLPHVEESLAPPPPVLRESPIIDIPKPQPEQNDEVSKDMPKVLATETPETVISSPTKQSKGTEEKKDDETGDMSPLSKSEESQDSLPLSPKRDWHEVKEKSTDPKKLPSKLDLVRAKLAEATKGKDRLGRPLLFDRSPSVEKERRRTISVEDTDMRAETSADEFDAEDHKKTISIIMTQAKEQFNDGQLDKNQYNTLMYQVLQLNEKLKLKEAKQKESLELSKRKLKASIEENKVGRVVSPKTSPGKPHNNFGDIDERVIPPALLELPPDTPNFSQDSDLRMPIVTPAMPPMGEMETIVPRPPLQRPMMMPMGPYMGPYPAPVWRGRPRLDEFGPRRMRAPGPPFYRGKFDKRLPRHFEPRMPILPTPKIGMCQGENPAPPYERVGSPPPLGTPGVLLPSTDIQILEYIDQDPVKSIQIDGIAREIRYYGETAVIMLDWDDPREISFLPGSRRITFDNKDSVVLSFNEPYKQVEIDDQVFDIRFGAPTRELYINRRWFECFFGGQPLGVIIDGKPRLIHLEGPLPQVDIGKVKRIDLVAGKINLIVDGQHMCPIYLDAKPQKFTINGMYFTIRFVDAFRTVLINETPFRVEYGGLPRPIVIGNEKHFIRFSVLPRHVRPGYSEVIGMEGLPVTVTPRAPPTAMDVDEEVSQPPIEIKDVDETSQDIMLKANRSPSPDGENKGLDMLASLMPSNVVPSSGSAEYSLAEPLFVKPDKIPGLDSSPDKPEAPNTFPILGNINVSDLFAKLVATGIVNIPEKKEEEKKVEVKPPPQKPKEDTTVVHKVDLLKIETLRVKQPGIVSKLYGGMQCSGCGARFPPEHTVKYSQHLDWHFRQNRRERDSARRAHSRHWHYDLSDWVQYEEIEDLEEREKNWFETLTPEGEPEHNVSEVPEEAPSVPAGLPADQFCALCGDKFDQFYNEDKEEWHLRKAVRHEDQNYHPLCFEDHKAALAKEAEMKINSTIVEIEETSQEKDLIEIREEEDIELSDNEVEVIEPEPPKPLESLEIVEDAEDDGDPDDVIFKAEPIDEVEVDECDTDDETQATRAERDKQAEIDFSKVKIKQEPIDPDDEPIITAEEEALTAHADTTLTTVQSSIDGNFQFEANTAPQHLPIGGIRINIHKTIPTFVTQPPEERMLEDISTEDEPFPPGEEPELEFKWKPHLEGVRFHRQPIVHRGTELSGLCSIM